MKTNKTLISIFIFTVLFSSINIYGAKHNKLPVKEISIIRNDSSIVKIEAEMAIKEADRNYGFMNRKKIPDGTGMMFVFEKDQILSFWMKNTPHPLSIAYIDYKGEIKDIFDMTPFSLSPIVGTSSARYALEVPQGWFSKENIKIGDKVVLDF